MRGKHFSATGAQTHLRSERGLLQLMAHRPIAIDGARSDGSTDVAGNVEPGPSNDPHGGDGACTDQVAVTKAPPRPSARDKDAVRHLGVNERRLSKPPKSQHWVRKHFMVYAKEALYSQHGRLSHLRGLRAMSTTQRLLLYTSSFVASHFSFRFVSFVFLSSQVGGMRSPRVLLQLYKS